MKEEARGAVRSGKPERKGLKQALHAQSGPLSLLPIAFSILCWTAATLFVKYFSYRMDVHTQNFFRYLGASVFLGLTVQIAYPGCFRRYLEQWRTYLLLGGMIVTFQVMWVKSVYLIAPGFASLLSKISTLFITLIAFIYYREERAVIRSPLFLLGVALGFGGMLGVVAGISNFGGGLTSAQKTGIALIMCSSLVWAIYANVVKRVLRTENSLQAFAFICISATLLFLPLLLLRGRPSDLLRQPGWISLLVVVSGVVGIAAANSSYFISIKRIGLATSANLVLINPFVTVLASFLVFGERLTIRQWFFGAVLLGGCALVLQAASRRRRKGDLPEQEIPLVDLTRVEP